MKESGTVSLIWTSLIGKTTVFGIHELVIAVIISTCRIFCASFAFQSFQQTQVIRIELDAASAK